MEGGWSRCEEGAEGVRELSVLGEYDIIDDRCRRWRDTGCLGTGVAYLPAWNVCNDNGIRAMPLPEEFWRELPEKSDAQLYNILAHADGYQPEVIDAVKEECRKRNLAPEEALQLKVAAEADKATEDAKALEPLGWPMRILIFLVCAGLAGILLACYYQSKGYDRKAKQCWITMGVSILCWIGLSVLSFVCNVL